jgi:hypothetical protein
LYHLRITIIDNGNQTRARGQHRLVVIRPSPIWLDNRDPSVPRCVKVNRKNLGQFLDAKWSNRNRDTL